MGIVWDILKKFGGIVSMLLIWWLAHNYFSAELVGVSSMTEAAWTTTWHYMVFLFVLVVLSLIVRSRITLLLIAIYGFSFAAQQVATVLDYQHEYLDRVTAEIAPMFAGIAYVADQKIGFGLGELAECGLGAFYGLFIGVVACSAWCFVNPGDGSTMLQRYNRRRRAAEDAREDRDYGDAIDDPLAMHRSPKKRTSSSGSGRAAVNRSKSGGTRSRTSGSRTTSSSRSTQPQGSPVPVRHAEKPVDAMDDTAAPRKLDDTAYIPVDQLYQTSTAQPESPTSQRSYASDAYARESYERASYERDAYTSDSYAANPPKSDAYAVDSYDSDASTRDLNATRRL